CQCVADITGDRLVNAADLSVLLGFWGSTNPPLPSVDINRDGIVGPADLSVLLSAWGACP
ncbi:MAG: Dockerin type domain, partial [Planctomycetota bacterium]